MAPDDVPPVQRFDLRTSDSAEADRWLQLMYCGHVLHHDASPAGFGLRITGSRTSRFRIETVHTSTSAAASGGPGLPLGAIQVRHGAATVSTDQLRAPLRDREWSVLDTSRPVRVASEGDVLIRVVLIDRAQIAAVAEELLGRPRAGPPPGARAPIAEFPLAAPLDREHARFWNDVVDHVEYDLLDSEDLMRSPLVRNEASRELATGVLICFPNSALAALLGAPPGPGEPGALRRATAYIDDHAGDPISTDDVAAAARSTVPDLLTLFRRHRDTTPQEYLQRVRLTRAHRDLQAGDPEQGDTVADVAARWGFTDLVRFTTDYQRRYGCSPTESLHR